MFLGLASTILAESMPINSFEGGGGDGDEEPETDNGGCPDMEEVGNFE